MKNGNINANTTEKGIQLVTVKAPLDDGRRAKHTRRLIKSQIYNPLIPRSLRRRTSIGEGGGGGGGDIYSYLSI